MIILLSIVFAIFTHLAHYEAKKYVFAVALNRSVNEWMTNTHVTAGVTIQRRIKQLNEIKTRYKLNQTKINKWFIVWFHRFLSNCVQLKVSDIVALIQWLLLSLLIEFELDAQHSSESNTNVSHTYITLYTHWPFTVHLRDTSVDIRCCVLHITYTFRYSLFNQFRSPSLCVSTLLVFVRT